MTDARLPQEASHVQTQTPLCRGVLHRRARRLRRRTGPPYGAPAAPYGYASDGEIVAAVAPPAPYVENHAGGLSSVARIGGYWGYHGGRHEWVPGRYEAPRPGYRYEPHHWVQQSAGHWRLEGGAWRRG